MGQDEVLLVRDADLVVRIVLGEIGDSVHLVGARVARDGADRFQRDGDRDIARGLVRHDVRGEEAREARVFRLAAFHAVADRLLRLKLGGREERAKPRKLLFREIERIGIAGGEFRLDLLAQRLKAFFVHQDLDARLEFVVAPSFEIIDAQDRLDVAEQVALGQELADHAPDHRRSAEASADIDAKADLARFVAHDLQSDVMGLDDRAIMRRAVDGDLELARQEREFGMERRPLPQDFGVRARVGDLVMRHSGEMVRRDVADAIPRSLDRVHLDARELGQNVGRVFERRPVELDILPGGEMAVAAVVFPRDLGQLAHLARVEHAVRDSDAQHIGVKLQVEAVHQPVRAELLLGQFAAEAARDLVAELLDPRGDEGGVEIVIMIHDRSPSRPWDPSAAPDLAPACPDRA